MGRRLMVEKNRFTAVFFNHTAIPLIDIFQESPISENTLYLKNPQWVKPMPFQVT
jgi:hypothetical protein